MCCRRVLVGCAVGGCWLAGLVYSYVLVCISFIFKFAILEHAHPFPHIDIKQMHTHSVPSTLGFQLIRSIMLYI